MSKYNINIDPQLPSKEETKSFQNFDSIINDAQNIHKPSYVVQNIHKNFKLVKIVILITVVLMTLFFSHKLQEKKERNFPKEENNNTTFHQNILLKKLC